MKINSKKIVLSSLAVAALVFTGCGGGGSASSGTTAVVPAVPSCDSTVIDVVLTGDIAAQTLDATKVYGLDGKVRLTSGDLTIPAGTTVAGCTPASYLIIKPGARIMADGNQTAPIKFTSQKDLQGLSAAGATGEWGGLVLLGNAYADGAPVQYEAGDIDDTFGRADVTGNADSSGILNYVLIKHTGYMVEIDKELNGLSLGAVGSGTTITNVAIIGGSDDGMEAWGGTVDVTGLYVTNAKDDSVDTDLGYTGTITNVYVKQNIVDSTNNHDSAAVETGNDTNGGNSTTLPKIVNLTAEVVGAGIYMKNDAGLDISNAKFTSAKALEAELVTYRTADVMFVGTMAASNVCFDNTTLVDTDVTTFANANTKDTSTETARSDWTGNLTGMYSLDGGCTGIGAVTANIWQGTAGSNTALE